MRHSATLSAIAATAFLAGISCGGVESNTGAPNSYVPATFDLSELPAYEPREMALGVIRICGTPLESLVGAWARDFRATQGHVRFQTYLINTSQAFAGLVEGVADVGIMGHRTWHTSLKAFDETFGYPPLEIRFATGSFDDPAGSTPGLMIIVHESNPLAHLTLDEIDGIFSTQRTGAWDGLEWNSSAARGPEGNIRTWGALGLEGKWVDKPIHVHGSDVTLSNWADLMEKTAFGGSRKWNPDLVEGPRADIAWKARGKTRDEQIIERVQEDPLAIGFMFQRVINATQSDVRVIPIGRTKEGPFIMPSAESFFDGSYPLHNSVYLYLNRVPGQKLRPKEEEFVRFVLSREGQQIVADSRIFIPLNNEQIQAELEKLE